MFWVIVPIAMGLSIVLIVMVLLQPSKGGGMGGAFGGLGSTLGSTFGSRRTLDFLAKGTTWTAGILAALCLLANLVISTGVGRASDGPPVPITTGTPKPQVAPAPSPLPGGKPGAQPGAPKPGAAQPAPTSSQPANMESHTPNVKVTPVTPQKPAR